MKKYVVAAVVVVGIALGAAACSSDSGGGHSGMDSMTSTTAPKSSTTASIPADASFNAADVEFAQSMIPHHAQAVQMADMALSQTSSAQIKELATRIKAAQDPEIQTMTTWLKQWGQTVPDTSMSMDAGMGGMSMDGMMTDGDMTKLGNSAGAQFDQMFLSMMVIHHQGAVKMAKAELADGKYGPAKALAQNVVTSQQAEITEMQQLETSLPAG